MTSPVRRILFSGDFLRPSAAELRPTQHENIMWLYRLLDVPVRMATDLPTGIVHWDNNWLNTSCLDVDSITAIYQAMWERPGIHAWARLFDAEYLPDAVEDLLAHLFAGSFVIGFELPRYLVNFFRRHDIGFVDCSIAPVRFMDDLLFDISASDAAMTDAIRPWRVSEALIRLQAGVVSSHVAKMNPNPPRPETLLLILQTRFDKVLLQKGRFASMLDHMDRLDLICKDYQHVLIKEHPLEPQQDTMARLLRQLPRAEMTKENFYRLVAHPNLSGVAALSSSCVLEAEYFGKTGHYILPDHRADRFTVGLEALMVDDALLMPDFWRDVLAASPCPVTPKDGLRLHSKPNRFRQQLRSAWGYNQIDTDISVAWARG